MLSRNGDRDGKYPHDMFLVSKYLYNMAHYKCIGILVKVPVRHKSHYDWKICDLTDLCMPKGIVDKFRVTLSPTQT